MTHRFKWHKNIIIISYIKFQINILLKKISSKTFFDWFPGSIFWSEFFSNQSKTNNIQFLFNFNPKSIKVNSVGLTGRKMHKKRIERRFCEKKVLRKNVLIASTLGVNLTSMFTRSFYMCRSQKRLKGSEVISHFAL